MEDLSKHLKLSLELKQTAKGFWYVGSLKVNADTISELDSLTEELLVKAKEKIKKVNTSSSSTEKKQVTEIILNDEEDELFARLKTLRLNIAKREGHPPYVIFHDLTLAKMVKERPKTREDMANLVGEKKFKRYGDTFLNAIQNF